MKSTLIFNLPEEREEFEAAYLGMDMKIAIDDIFNEVFRSRIKHGLNDEEAKLSSEDLLWKIRDEISEIVNERCGDLFK